MTKAYGWIPSAVKLIILILLPYGRYQFGHYKEQSNDPLLSLQAHMEVINLHQCTSVLQMPAKPTTPKYVHALLGLRAPASSMDHMRLTSSYSCLHCVAALTCPENDWVGIDVFSLYIILSSIARICDNDSCIHSTPNKYWKVPRGVVIFARHTINDSLSSRQHLKLEHVVVGALNTW